MPRRQSTFISWTGSRVMRSQSGAPPEPCAAIWHVELRLPAAASAREPLACRTEPPPPALYSRTGALALLGSYWSDVACESASWPFQAFWPSAWTFTPPHPAAWSADWVGWVSFPAADFAAAPPGGLFGRLGGLVVVAGRGLRRRRVDLLDVTVVALALDAHGRVGVAGALLRRVSRRVGLLLARCPLTRGLHGGAIAAARATAPLAGERAQDRKARAGVLRDALCGVVGVAGRREGARQVGLRDITVIAGALDA